MNSFKDIKWVSFDFLNTLAHLDRSPSYILLTGIKDLGLALEDEFGALKKFSELLFEARLDYRELSENGGLKDARHFWDKIFQRWAESMDLKLSSKQLNTLAWYACHYVLIDSSGTWEMFPDVLPTLKTLHGRGYRMAVISNAEVSLYGWLRLLGISDYLEFELPCYTIGVLKPDPQAFKFLLQKIGAVAEEVLHVGDSYGDDYLGAQNVGMPALLLDRDGTQSGEHVLHDLEILLDLLPERGQE